MLGAFVPPRLLGASLTLYMVSVADNAMIMAARQTDVLQQEVTKIKKQQEMEVAAYRSKFQQKKGRREWDLSDPDRIKKDTVPTVRLAGFQRRSAACLRCLLQDHPEELGLSSAQLFPGMDQTNYERAAQQKQQLREWCAAQIADKDTAKAAELAAERCVNRCKKIADAA